MSVQQFQFKVYKNTLRCAILSISILLVLIQFIVININEGMNYKAKNIRVKQREKPHKMFNTNLRIRGFKAPIDHVKKIIVKKIYETFLCQRKDT